MKMIHARFIHGWGVEPPWGLKESLTRYSIQDPGSRILDLGSRIQDLGPGSRIQDPDELEMSELEMRRIRNEYSVGPVNKNNSNN